jgi:xanthine dehydrogenase accessory factor
MSELARIAGALRAAGRNGQSSVLATVVRTEGSTYRRIGARLVVVADGTRVGAVSAGCLEHEVVLRADGVSASGIPDVVQYDTRSPDDLVWGFGLGCGGLVEVLLEPLTPEESAAKAARLASVADTRHRIVLATAVRAPSGMGIRVGDQAVLAGVSATLDGFAGELHGDVQRVARQVLRGGRSIAASHAWRGGRVDLAYEVIVPRVHVAVCGAGVDAQPLVAAAKRLDWHVTLIDDRPAMAAAHRWPEADRIIVPRPSAVADCVAELDTAAAIIMSHNFERDADFLEGWLASDATYIGVMGPRHRTNALVATVRSRGVSVDATALERIHGPIGLDIGAESPEEIAVAIVAELQAVHVGREGRFLGNRRGAIHAGVATVATTGASHDHDVRQYRYARDTAPRSR